MSQKNGKRSVGKVSRRDFVKLSTVAAVGSVAVRIPYVHAQGDGFQVRIGLIGCGGRGTGAALNALGAATRVIYPSAGYHTEDAAEGSKAQRKDVSVVALADLFEDRLSNCRTQLAKVGVEVPNDHCFVGFDAYKKLLALDEVNYVILATPPHFRPDHLTAAIEAGKNVFMEKPVAVDVPGVKKVLAAGELAKQKNLGIVAGTQRRHQASYVETIKRIHDGAIGDIIYAKAYWNGGEIWVIERQPGWSDMEWQLRNWNYFTWLSGDHIVEQHVHNLDVMNWVLGTHPIRAVSAVGGRQVRTDPKYGNIYDHFAVEFEYPNGVTVFSQCRQTNGCKNIVGEEVIGTKGTSNCANTIVAGDDRWRFRDKQRNPYEQEHEDLINSIREGKPLNEAKNVAESTMTGIIGREAAYSGDEIRWDDAMQSTTRLGPEKYEFGPYEFAPVRMPGRYEFS
ncbi:Gfo/Idh/MocA family oxidoreductase [Thermostilla marina]